MVGGTLGSPETVSGVAEGGKTAVPPPRREDWGATCGAKDPREKVGGTPLPTVGMEWWALIGIPWVGGRNGGEDGGRGEVEEGW